MNVNKIIACSDIHVPALKGIEELKQILQSFIDDCKKVVEEEGDKSNVRIVVCGDIFHNKLSITNESIICVHWFLSELGKVAKTIVVIGNHDMLMNNTDRVDSLTSIFEIGKLSNVVYLDKELGYKSGCLKDDNIVWCLYSSYDAFNSPDIESFKTKSRSKTPLNYVGLIHTDINGAITTTNYVTEKGIDPNVFSECDFVIAGHIHKRQELKKNGVKIVYCSSISQKDYGESVSEHGYVLWTLPENPEEDDATYEYVDVPNPDGGFYKFVINDIDDIKNDNEELINL